VNQKHNPDPVCQYKDGWYFWNEIWCDKYGPYETEEECRQELDEYCKEFL
jgi:hypothetical protein